MANIYDLTTLQIFCDLLDLQSFSRTADKHYITQSAVSQRLRTLETAYAKTLVDRGKGRGIVAATEAGHILYEGAKRILRDVQTLDAQLREMSDEMSGTLHVATVYSIGLHALPPRLKPFLAAHPKVNVHLEYKQTETVYQDVLSGAVDVGIVACPLVKRGVEVLPFDEEAMVLICAPEHALAQETEVRLRQLDGIAFIGFDSDIPTRKLIEGRLQAADVRVRVVTTFDNIETIKNIVEIGNGVSIVPRDTVIQEVRAGTLAAIPFVAAEAFLRPTGLIVKKTAVRRATVTAFIEAMQK